METFKQRTDLAFESREIANKDAGREVEGIEYTETILHGVQCRKLRVVSKAGADNIGKPMGAYITLDISALTRRESESFTETVTAMAEILTELAELKNKDLLVLVVGLGNRDITPDAIGPLTAESTLVTRHLKSQMPEDFAFFRPVSVISPGVLGTSGIESADYIKAVCKSLSPDLIIAVDALAAKSFDRLCRTVQITDTGITPGSGVGNSRAQINKETMGVPVIAVGVPTVVDIRTVLAEYWGDSAASERGKNSDMIVTPRSIDSEVSNTSKLVAYAINLALHKGITVEDVDMLVG
ncbi:MAG: GPR endopeptidase [Clostridiales bacterium]|nr:GPR endopeptidase [Clostridiales bacterium]